MALFGREKSEDDDYEDDEEFEEERRESLEERRLKRQLRDLKAENKKKRKEPSKPWGRKERLMILMILGITILVSAFLAIGSRGIGGLNLSKFQFKLAAPDLNGLNIFKEQTIEIRKK